MGVQKEVLAAGDGSSFPKTGDTVIMHYVGTFEDGTQYGTSKFYSLTLLTLIERFDSSHDRGMPFTTVIGTGKVIRGT
jgi:FK506-binding protein 1